MSRGCIRSRGGCAWFQITCVYLLPSSSSSSSTEPIAHWQKRLKEQLSNVPSTGRSMGQEHAELRSILETRGMRWSGPQNHQKAKSQSCLLGSGFLSCAGVQSHGAEQSSMSTFPCSIPVSAPCHPHCILGISPRLTQLFPSCSCSAPICFQP